MKIKVKYVAWVIFSVIFAIASGEIFARYYLGLGTPPLSVSHPTIEYMYKPNQDIYRFGNHFIINQYGMRSAAFAKKRNANELRIMVFGDSVVNGGVLTDQSELATSILKNKLTAIADKNAIVANISAGSWGPGNWLAYAKEYGFFDADIVVLVLSSHDYADNPTFEPLNPNTHPSKAPISALFEGIEKYLPRYLSLKSKNQSVTTEVDQFATTENRKETKKGLNDLRNFLKLAQNNSTTVLVFQHYEKLEIDRDRINLGNQHIKMICKQLGIVPISLEPYFRKSIAEGVNPYRDNIHPNKVGQRLIAEAMLAKIPNKFLEHSSNRP